MSGLYRVHCRAVWLSRRADGTCDLMPCQRNFSAECASFVCLFFLLKKKTMCETLMDSLAGDSIPPVPSILVLSVRLFFNFFILLTTWWKILKEGIRFATTLFSTVLSKTLALGPGKSANHTVNIAWPRELTPAATAIYFGRCKTTLSPPGSL